MGHGFSRDAARPAAQARTVPDASASAFFGYFVAYLARIS